MLPSNIITNDLLKAKIILLGVPYDKTASGQKGTASAPFKIINQLQTQVEDFDLFFQKSLSSKVKIGAYILNEVKNLKPDLMVKKVFNATKKFLNQNKFVVLIGGEHTISLGAILAYKEKFKDLTVLQFDAHLDMRENTGDYEKEAKRIAHSTVMKRAFDAQCFIVQVGIRSASKEEFNFLKEKKLLKNVIFAWDFLKINPSKILSLIPSKNVYLTIDVDAFSAGDFPHTGTPEPGGISWYKFIETMNLVFKKKNVVGFDVVEALPQKFTHYTEYGCAKLIYNLLGRKFLS